MRKEILKGALALPGNRILELYPDQYKDIEAFWSAVWFNFLNDNETNGLHWYERLGIKLYNDLIRRLSHHGWIESNSLVGRKWASVKLLTKNLLYHVSEEELENVKAEHKYDKYMLGFNEVGQSDLVRQNGKTTRTGLVREGFRDSGSTQFAFCMETLGKYEDALVKNLTKSMDKIRRVYPEMKSTKSSYDEVSVAIYNWHKDNSEELFTTGKNVSDSRGRAISACLRKVTNPIANKDFRASLIITYPE